jgi:hypothetical protein
MTPMNPSNSSLASVAPSHHRVLVVEPDEHLLASRTLLLSSSNYLVTAAGSHRDVFDLSCMTEIHLAVLSDTLGRSGLCSAAEYVRAQWPSARILILGTAQFVLEDYLYDEAVGHGLQPKGLLDTLERLSENRRNQTSKDIGSRLSTPACLDEWLTFPRSKFPESDPTKGIHPTHEKNFHGHSSGRNLWPSTCHFLGSRRFSA